VQEEGAAVSALGSVTSYRPEADGSSGAGERLGSSSGRGALVLDVEQSHAAWGRLSAFGVVRSKAGVREGALELEPATAGVRGAAGGREESGSVSMTLGSPCSCAEVTAGGGVTAQGLSAAGAFLRGGGSAWQSSPRHQQSGLHRNWSIGEERRHSS